MLRWLAYCLMTVSLAAAVFLHGGVLPDEWGWSAVGLAIGATIWVTVGPPRDRAPGNTWGLAVLAALLGWMLLQLVPLPPGLVAWLSPQHWQAVIAARAVTGQDAGAWVALSVAPPATTERLLYVLPAMATFVAAREMAWWWSERMWIAIAPVVGIAWIESVLGLVQFYFMRMAGGPAGSATGTYVNRNHFSGLLEMALPVAIVWVIATWRKNTTRHEQPVGVAIATAILLGVSACILMGVVLSLSRMGFISTLVAAAVILLMLLASMGSPESRWSRWRWAIPAGVLAFILALLPTQELVLRFADLAATEEVGKDTRVEIWQDTLLMTSDYKWAGCGLGAYEQCLYRYKTTAPVNTVDFAHNDYLQIFAELGVIGSALVAGLAGWILWRLLSVVLWMRGAENWHMAVGLFGAVVMLGMHSMADFNLYIPANAAAFAWLAGVAVSPGLRRY